MTDSVVEHTTIAAPREECLAVLLDFERYPEWARDLKAVTVLERDAEGRGLEVRYRAAGMGYSTSYTLRYDYDDPDRLAWRLVKGDLARKLDGHYAFTDQADGSVLVEYLLEAELILPLPGFIKRRTQLKITHTALKELKARVEARGERVRVLLFTGKGGVGKTTTAAATALRCADAGLRTIVLSTDPAHSLADAFDVGLGSIATPVTDGLWGQHLDAQERMEDAWADIQHWLVEVFEWAGVAGIEAEELSVLPGLDEIFGLSDIKSYADSGEWDVVVVDCAPTAETIRLLSLPDILAWYMDRVFPASRRLNKVVSPILARVSNLPVAGDEVFGSARTFYERLDGVRELLTDTSRTSVRLVVNPERMVIAEARRTYTYLSLYGYGVDAVVANRLLPDEIQDPWFATWKDLHVEHLRTIEDGFAPFPVLRAELARDELVGLDRLRGFGDALYGDLDPSARLHEGEAMRVRTKGDTAELELELPFADRDDLDLGRRDDELLIRVGPYRRALLLPDSLRRRPVVAATMRDGRLVVTFAAARAANRAAPARRAAR